MATHVLLLCLVAGAVAQTRSTSTDGLFPIVKGFKYGYINKSGHVVVRPRFDYAGNFSEGLGRFEINGRYGFIDTTGSVAILSLACRRMNTVSFRNGVAQVLVRYKVNYPMKIGYIDRRGRYIWKPQI